MQSLALIVALAFGGTAASAACVADRVELRGGFGKAAFRVEVADDAKERAQGLMHRPSMPSGAGMLFVYPNPQVAAFWMKNTLIPLDMIFLNARGVVRHVHTNAVPGDETTIRGGHDILLVLEVNGGLAERLGIGPGDQLRHPAVPQDNAAWPCD